MFKIGDKIKIPKTKSYGDSIVDSNIIKSAINSYQDYLYIANTNNNNYLIVTDNIRQINEDINLASGDFFLKSDLELYEEPFILPELYYIECLNKEEINVINEWFTKTYRKRFDFSFFESVETYYFPNLDAFPDENNYLDPELNNNYSPLYAFPDENNYLEGYIKIADTLDIPKVSYSDFIKYVIEKDKNKESHITTEDEWIQLLINHKPKTIETTYGESILNKEREETN